MLGKSVRGVAAGTTDKGTQEYILQSSKQVMEQSVSLIREAKTSVEVPNQPNKQLRLAQVRACAFIPLLHSTACLYRMFRDCTSTDNRRSGDDSCN